MYLPSEKYLDHDLSVHDLIHDLSDELLDDMLDYVSDVSNVFRIFSWNVYE